MRSAVPMRTNRTVIGISVASLLGLACFVCSGGGFAAFWLSGGAKLVGAPGPKRDIDAMVQHLRNSGFAVEDRGPPDAAAGVAEARRLLIDGAGYTVSRFDLANDGQVGTMENVRHVGTYRAARHPVTVNPP